MPALACKAHSAYLQRKAEADEANSGKQMELEAGNAIQYRTCSWQKV